MPYHEFLWADRAIEKIEDNGLEIAEIEYAVRHSLRRESSRGSDREVFIGRTPSGELICVPFEEIDSVVIAPITAFRM
jgi:uncharacterized DUF497 family protein